MLYVIAGEDVPDSSAGRAAHRPAHLARLEALLAEGRLVLAGPHPAIDSPDPGPAGWSLVWADEFDEPAGSSPNPANWTFAIGDGTANGIPGWGNSELQYYTDDPANAATDGAVV